MFTDAKLSSMQLPITGISPCRQLSGYDILNVSTNVTKRSNSDSGANTDACRYPLEWATNKWPLSAHG